jgi:hypothetical protein
MGMNSSPGFRSRIQHIPSTATNPQKMDISQAFCAYLHGTARVKKDIHLNINDFFVNIAFHILWHAHCFAISSWNEQARTGALARRMA